MTSTSISEPRFFRFADPADFGSRRGALPLTRRQEARLLRGTSIPAEPVLAQCGTFGRFRDLIWTTWLGPLLVSDRILEALSTDAITGWRSFPVRLQCPGVPSNREYAGLQVLGRHGSIDYTRALRVPNGDEVERRGIDIDRNSWDGSDIFLPVKGFSFPFATERVVRALASQGIDNVRFEAIEDIVINPLVAGRKMSLPDPTHITFETVGEELLALHPRLQEEYWSEGWGIPGSLPSSVDIIPFLEEFLRDRATGPSGAEVLRALKEILVQLATHENGNIRDVVESIVERLEESWSRLPAQVRDMVTRIREAGRAHVTVLQTVGSGQADSPTRKRESSFGPIQALTDHQGRLIVPRARFEAARPRHATPDEIYRAFPPYDLESISAASLDLGRLGRRIQRGEAFPNRAVNYHSEGGRWLGDLIWTRSAAGAGPPLISQRAVGILEAANLTGWSTYPVRFFGPDGTLIDGYAGLAVKGRSGPLAWTEVAVEGEDGIVTRVTQAIDIRTWDGSDFFVGSDDDAKMLMSIHAVTVIEEEFLRPISLQPLLGGAGSRWNLAIMPNA